MKVFHLSILFAALILFASCGNDTTPYYSSDTDSYHKIDDAVPDSHADEDTAVVADEDIGEAADEDVDISDTSDTGELPDGGDFQKTGEFSLTFQGKVNVDLSNYQNIKGGTGEVHFSHNGTEYTYKELTVVIMQLFPIAIDQSGKVAIMWLDKAPGLGAEVHQVFGFTYPDTMTDAGEYQMEEIQAYAFFGDINIDLRNSVFEVKCIRSAAVMGDADFASASQDNLDLEASGDLLDPTTAASQLPYPVCDD